MFLRVSIGAGEPRFLDVGTGLKESCGQRFGNVPTQLSWDGLAYPFQQAVQRCITLGGRTLIARRASRTEKFRWVMQVIVKFAFEFRRVSVRNFEQEMWQEVCDKEIQSSYLTLYDLNDFILSQSVCQFPEVETGFVHMQSR